MGINGVGEIKNMLEGWNKALAGVELKFASLGDHATVALDPTYYRVSDSATKLSSADATLQGIETKIRAASTEAGADGQTGLQAGLNAVAGHVALARVPLAPVVEQAGTRLNGQMAVDLVDPYYHTSEARAGLRHLMSQA